MAKKPKSSRGGEMPSDEEILQFLSQSKGSLGKREIVRAFGLKGGQRTELKRLLRAMADDGRISRRGRRVRDKDALPEVTTVEIVAIDRDGELIGQPVEWDELVSGKPPRVLMRSGQGAGSQAGRGDRVLARIGPTGDKTYPYEGRVVRKLAGEENRVLGVYRAIKGHGARIVPVDKKARHDFIVAAGGDHGAEPGELVEIEIARDRGRGPPKARVRRRLGDLKDQRNISLIAVHEHGIPTHFPEKALAEAKSLKNFSPAGRVDLRHMPLITIDPVDARDHDDAVHAEPDSDPVNPGGWHFVG